MIIEKRTRKGEMNTASTNRRNSISSSMPETVQAGQLAKECHPCRSSVQSHSRRSVKPQRQAVSPAGLSHTRKGSAFFILTPRKRQSLAEREADVARFTVPTA